MKNLTIKLAWANLSHRPLGTLLTIATLGTAVALMSLLIQFSGHTETRLSRDLADVDLVVGAKGSPLQLILSSLLHVDVPTGNIPLEDAQALMRNPQVRTAVPLALGDSFRGFRIIGTTADFLGLYDADLAYGTPMAHPQQVIIGSLVHKTLGMQIGQRFVGAHGLSSSDEGLTKHAHTPYTVVGILKPTGSILDRLVITSIDSVWLAHSPHAGHHHEAEPDEHEAYDHEAHEHEAHEHNGHIDHHHGESDEKAEDHDHAEEQHHGEDHDHHEETDMAHAREEALPLLDISSMIPGDREITALLIRYASPIAAVRLPRAINEQPGLQAAAPAIEVTRLFSLSSGLVSAAQTVAILLALVGGLSIFAAISSATAAGLYDVALMRAMGTKPSFVFLERMLEGALLAAASALFGTLMAHIALLVAYQTYDSLMIFGLNGGKFYRPELYLIASTVFIGTLAALWPAISCYRTDPSLLLQQGR